MKTKFAKEIAENIREDKEAIKDYKQEAINPVTKWPLNYTYRQAMKEDSTEQTICGQLLIEKIFVTTAIPKLIEDIDRLNEKIKKSYIKEFSDNVSQRYKMSQRIDMFGSSKPEVYLMGLEPHTSNENTLWEQGYILGLSLGLGMFREELKKDYQSLSKLVNYD